MKQILNIGLVSETLIALGVVAVAGGFLKTWIARDLSQLLGIFLIIAGLEMYRALIKREALNSIRTSPPA